MFQSRNFCLAGFLVVIVSAVEPDKLAVSVLGPGKAPDLLPILVPLMALMIACFGIAIILEAVATSENSWKKFWQIIDQLGVEP